MIAEVSEEDRIVTFSGMAGPDRTYLAELEPLGDEDHVLGVTWRAQTSGLSDVKWTAESLYFVDGRFWWTPGPLMYTSSDLRQVANLLDRLGRL